MRRRLKPFWLTLCLFFLSASFFYLYGLHFDMMYEYNHHILSTESTESVIKSSVSGVRQVTKSLAQLGKMDELNEHILFFNRVPKAGSEMLVLLLQWLQGRNNFMHVRMKGGDKRKLSVAEQEAIVDKVVAVAREKAVPLSFDRHVYFVNFTSFDRQSPTYMNLIRDPVDKVTSRFYYKRVTPNPRNPDLKHAPKKREVLDHGSLDECVEMRKDECVFKNGLLYDLTIPYFCGQEDRCMAFNDKWALATAKSNVERYFPVVGVLEELNTTFEVLEHKIPYFFNGIQNVYFKEIFQLHYNMNKKKPQIKQNVRDYFKGLFVCEYEFYNWIKSRLFQQLQIIYGHNH